MVGWVRLRAHPFSYQHIVFLRDIEEDMHRIRKVLVLDLDPLRGLIVDDDVDNLAGKDDVNARLRGWQVSDAGSFEVGIDPLHDEVS